MPRDQEWVTPGTMIRTERLTAGLTQKQLAELVGYIDASGISNIERGNTGIGPDRWERFRAVLPGLPPSLPLVDGDGHFRTRPTAETLLHFLEEATARGARERDEIRRILEAMERGIVALDERVTALIDQARKAQ